MDSRTRSWITDYVAHPKHGPLPALLLVMTVVSGLVDAVSILALGRVFVANMTGNVVFIAFAAAGAPGFSLIASICAIGGFLVGAGVAGDMVRATDHRGRMLRNSAIVEFGLLLISLVILLTVTTLSTQLRDVVIVLIAVAMGVQNASVRRIAVPDFTTTVLTMTLTGIAADLRSAGYAVALRRTLAVISMFLGAVIGAVIVLHGTAAAAVAVATVLIALVGGAAGFASRTPAAWQTPV